MDNPAPDANLVNAPPAVPDIPTQAPPEPPLVTRVFLGPNGLRAGWRLLIYLAIVGALNFGAHSLVVAVSHLHPKRTGEVVDFKPLLFAASDWLGFFILLLGAVIMSAFERRKVGEYGLPLRGTLGARFWEGAAWGFVAISTVLLSLHLARGFDFGSLAIHGREAWRYAAEYGIMFLGVGFAEEYAMRGYTLYTLTTGIGFWPAVVIMSAVFAAVHVGNPGETAVGLITVALFGLLCSWILLRTGNLWFAVGIHMGWDWGQSYFYGVRDSGIPMPGHLLEPSFHGPVWLTGGTVGPEASIATPIALFIIAVLIYLRFPSNRYALAVHPKNS